MPTCKQCYCTDTKNPSGICTLCEINNLNNLLTEKAGENVISGAPQKADSGETAFQYSFFTTEDGNELSVSAKAPGSKISMRSPFNVFQVTHVYDDSEMKIVENPDGSGTLRCTNSECHKGFPLSKAVMKVGTLAAMILALGTKRPAQ